MYVPLLYVLEETKNGETKIVEFFNTQEEVINEIPVLFDSLSEAIPTLTQIHCYFIRYNRISKEANKAVKMEYPLPTLDHYFSHESPKRTFRLTRLDSQVVKFRLAEQDRQDAESHLFKVGGVQFDIGIDALQYAFAPSKAVTDMHNEWDKIQAEQDLKDALELLNRIEYVESNGEIKVKLKPKPNPQQAYSVTALAELFKDTKLF